MEFLLLYVEGSREKPFFVVGKKGQIFPICAEME
jgi:hypothetical protein